MNVDRISQSLIVISLLLGCFGLVNLEEGAVLPVHWNIYGVVDKTARAEWALLGIPVIMAVLYALPRLLQVIEPRRKHFSQSLPAIQSIMLGITLFLFIFEVAYVLISLGVGIAMMNVIAFDLGLLFVMMGNFLGKLRSNFFVGIRTPWTLSSDDIWVKTHRLAGKLTVIAGMLAMLLAAVADRENVFYVVTCLLLPSILVPVLYSWLLWRKQLSV